VDLIYQVRRQQNLFYLEDRYTRTPCAGQHQTRTLRPSFAGHIVAMGMFNDITKPAPPLPRTTAKEIQPDIKLLHPLTRRGSGPGLIVLLPSKDDFLSITEGVPSIPIKWAEEGYTVVGVSDLGDDVKATLKTALRALEACHECSPKEKVGLVCGLRSSLCR
jgi:hypothetical protein